MKSLSTLMMLGMVICLLKDVEATDPRGRSATVGNQAGFCGKISVRCNPGYESYNSDDYCNGNTKKIDLMADYTSGTLKADASCWILWHMDGGSNHESGVS